MLLNFFQSEMIIIFLITLFTKLKRYSNIINKIFYSIKHITMIFILIL